MPVKEIGRFTGTLRNDFLNKNWFESFAQGRQTIYQWGEDYWEIKPHIGMGGIPHAQFSAITRQPKIHQVGLQPLDFWKIGW